MNRHAFFSLLRPGVCSWRSRQSRIINCSEELLYIWLFMTHQYSADMQGHFEAHIISLHCKINNTQLSIYILAVSLSKTITMKGLLMFVSKKAVSCFQKIVIS